MIHLAFINFQETTHFLSEVIKELLNRNKYTTEREQNVFCICINEWLWCKQQDFSKKRKKKKITFPVY